MVFEPMPWPWGRPNIYMMRMYMHPYLYVCENIFCIYFRADHHNNNLYIEKLKEKTNMKQKKFGLRKKTKKKKPRNAQATQTALLASIHRAPAPAPRPLALGTTVQARAGEGPRPRPLPRPSITAEARSS